MGGGAQSQVMWQMTLPVHQGDAGDEEGCPHSEEVSQGHIVGQAACSGAALWGATWRVQCAVTVVAIVHDGVGEAAL